MAKRVNKESQETINLNLDKISEFQNEIITWFSANGRRFFWRVKKVSKYKLIIAEVLLQRTPPVSG